MSQPPQKDWQPYYPVPTLEVHGPPSVLRRSFGRIAVVGLTAGLIFLALTGCAYTRSGSLWVSSPATKQEVKALAICATGTVPDGTGACTPAPVLQPLPQTLSTSTAPSPPRPSTATVVPPLAERAAIEVEEKQREPVRPSLKPKLEVKPAPTPAAAASLQRGSAAAPPSAEALDTGGLDAGTQQQLSAAVTPVLPTSGGRVQEAGGVAPSAPARPGVAEPEGQELTFYMYRAQDDKNYVVQNVNTATLAGVMWYLEKEVVRGYCPRHYGITRILRFRATVRQPPGLEHNFSRFVAFDSGKCTTPGCTADFQQHGYAVGCQRQLGAPYGPNPVWYSLPGSCPSVDFRSKTPACEIAEPGGRCAAPNGAKDCTWSLQDAGEISIAELEGIPDYNAFCTSGGNEYTMPFWDGRGNPQYNEVRMQKTKNLFRSKYPSMPDLPDPDCDWL